jgi:hypothetical protein
MVHPSTPTSAPHTHDNNTTWNLQPPDIDVPAKWNNQWLIPLEDAQDENPFLPTISTPDTNNTTTTPPTLNPHATIYINHTQQTLLDPLAPEYIPNNGEYWNHESEEPHDEPHDNRKIQTPTQTMKPNINKEITRILTQNVRGLPAENDTKLKLIIHQMKSKNWDAACLQENWQLEEDDFYIDGYRVFLQGSSTKTNNHRRIMGGVAIILSRLNFLGGGSWGSPGGHCVSPARVPPYFCLGV